MKNGKKIEGKASSFYTQLGVENGQEKIIKRHDGYTFAEMQRTLFVGWGDQGLRVAQYWLDYNQLYFAGQLQPLPMFLTPCTPYGHMLGWTCCCQTITHIALCAPREGTVLVADRNSLLHEMIHQHLHEQGLYFKHDGAPWRQEIMRLHRQITGKNIWAGKYTVGKKKVGDGFMSVRMNRPDPESGQASISQKKISCWPYSLGINLGAL
jgi:hypothetical protein